MRSSASTPSRPEPPIRLGIVLVGDDHPRACTGRRLLRSGLARELRSSSASITGAVVLDPFAPVPLSSADRARAQRHGIVAIDCSWNRLSSQRASGPRAAARPSDLAARRLPMLVATNPQHFGRWAELNTVEALAAALVVLGRRTEADGLLGGFAGGRTFLEVNAARFARYERARTAEEVLHEEQGLFGQGGRRRVGSSGPLRAGAPGSRSGDGGARRR